LERREELQAARSSSRNLETQRRSETKEIKSKRRDLPCGPCPENTSSTPTTCKKTLADSFDGRSQLLAYNIMFAPTTRAALAPAAPRGRRARGSLVHLNHRDVKLLMLSLAPSDR